MKNELNWVDYEPSKYINIPNGFYISKSDGTVADFASGPRDEYIWVMKDGRVTKGLKKEEFLNNFIPFK